MLTYEDFRHLQHNPAANARAAIAGKIHYHLENSEEGSQSHQLAIEIIHYLHRDPKEEVRQQLSQGISRSPRMPKGVVLVLANDVSDAVAIPILQHSPVLDADDLTAIVRKTERLTRLLAVASREKVESEVCEALLEKKQTEVASQLAKNEGAALTEAHLDKMVKWYGNHDALWSQLALRRDHEKLQVVWYRQDAMQKAANDEAAQPASSRDNGILPPNLNLQRQMLMVLGNQNTEEALYHMVEQYNREGMLNASLLIMALCMGNRRFVAACFARQLKMPLPEAELHCGAADHKFRQMYIKSRLSTSFLPLVQHMLEGCNTLLAQGFAPYTRPFELAMAEYLQAAIRGHVNFARTVGTPIIELIRQG